MWPHELQNTRLPRPSLSPSLRSNSCPLSQWWYLKSSHPLPPPLSFCLQSFPHQVFSHESVVPIRWPKYWSFSFIINTSNEYSGLISIQFSSVVQPWPTFCDPKDCSMPDLPVQHQLPEFTQTHVRSQWHHWVSDVIQPSHTLSFPSPAFNLSQHQHIFQWVSSLYQVAKVLEFQLQHQSFQWVTWTGFLYDWLVLSPCGPKDSQVFSNTTTQKHQFFSTQPSLWSNSHICIWILEKP